MLQSTTTKNDHLRTRLELASRLGALGSDARDLVELFRALYDETARVMDATVFLFAIYDPVSQTVQVVRQMDRGEEHGGGSFPLGKGFTSEVIRTGEPRIVSWAAEGPPIRLLYGTEPGELVSPRSGVVVPIVSGDRVVGVLSAQSYRPEAYEEEDLLGLCAIGAQAGATIKRLRATEQMALEHERHALQLEAVLASMNDALLIVDSRGAIVRLNRAARELLCLDGSSLVLGQPLERQRLEQWPDTAREIAEALIPVIDAIRAGKKIAEVDVELHSGERRVLSLGASVLRSPTAFLEGGVIVFRDITAQRDLERLREDIFAMAWHDMHTPITVIRGHAELLQRRLASGDRNRAAFKTAASLIMKHADRLAELLTALFDIRCLEAGVLTVARWPMDLTALVREVTEGIRPTARHEIIVTAPEGVVGEWDERRIHQVVTNLVANAMKYSPEGSTVAVSVTSDESAATVRVRDEGIGLDVGELAQLFGRGYRAESVRTVRGAGLGLYLSNGLVTAHGGRMWAESLGHGHGSTFCFTLPLHVEGVAERPMAAERPMKDLA
ncbi:MAG: GAF domain-containing protein [Chloroflexi bacterium]|nr:MAG: GAF domain-containing protein [Chloroflexota bacterium]